MPLCCVRHPANRYCKSTCLIYALMGTIFHLFIAYLLLDTKSLLFQLKKKEMPKQFKKTNWLTNL